MQIEEPCVASALFTVSSFTEHCRRTRFKTTVGDSDLLARTWAMHFEMDSEEIVTASQHQLRSMYHLESTSGIKERWKLWARAIQVRYSSLMLDFSLREPATVIVPAVGTVTLHVACFCGREKTCEFELLANQTLLALRDALTCITFAEMSYRRHELHRRDLERAAVTLAPDDSAAFCIEGEWFITGPSDLSVEARAQARMAMESMLDGGCATRTSFLPAEMGRVTLAELQLRLGARYLFVHHGECQHSIIFTRCAIASAVCSVLDGGTYPVTDSQLTAAMERADSSERIDCNQHSGRGGVNARQPRTQPFPCRHARRRSSASYQVVRMQLAHSDGSGTLHPKLVWQRPLGLLREELMCIGCFITAADWSVHTDSLADMEPCNLCHQCHFELHYQPDGSAKYIGYKIYPIVSEQPPFHPMLPRPWAPFRIDLPPVARINQRIRYKRPTTSDGLQQPRRR